MKAEFSGIYRISTDENAKFYIGSSINIERRISQHLYMLKRGTHRNPHLQAAYAKYGEEAMRFSVVEECSRADLLMREQHYLDLLKPEYNICLVAGNTLGYRHTPEAKAKMAVLNAGNQRMLGKKHTAETRAALSLIAQQRKHSDERRAKASQRMKGNANTLGMKLTQDHRAKVGAGSQAAWDANPERKASTSNRVKELWANPEWKAAQLAKIKAGREKRYGDGQVRQP